uniref:Uncharacterized protein n=1 Tax=Acrobeloides nanus TaxID=290746 RepID=A0A914D8Y2_9BILA
MTKVMLMGMNVKKKIMLLMIMKIKKKIKKKVKSMDIMLKETVQMGFIDEAIMELKIMTKKKEKMTKLTMLMVATIKRVMMSMMKNINMVAITIITTILYMADLVIFMIVEDMANMVMNTIPQGFQKEVTTETMVIEFTILDNQGHKEN